MRKPNEAKPQPVQPPAGMAKFDALTRKLLQVPRAELEREMAKHEAAKAKRARAKK